jgi:UDP-N-acetylmuramate dehydrogenase
VKPVHDDSSGSAAPPGASTRPAPPQTGADLSRHTTLGLGGPASRLETATDQHDLVRLVQAAHGDLFLLAGGSNVVIGDGGVAGTVVLIRTAGIAVSGAGPDALVAVEAGQPWDEVVAFCVAEGLSGIECLSGIPGSAGATPIQNVGAYGQEVAETIRTVRVLDRRTGAVAELGAGDCGFAYRTSAFKGSDRHVVLSVTFGLRRDPLSAPLRYAELARRLDVSPGARAPLAEVRAAVLALRAGKGMVLDPADPDTRSVGSFFTNPVLSAEGFEALLERAGAEPPHWPDANGTVKISAAWLIEHAGFGKGYAGEHPGVAISSKHTLALTNRGTGTTSALLDLAREIRDGVVKAFDVRLYPEPVLVACSL